MTGRLVVLFLLLADIASAQFNNGPASMADRVRVRVLLMDGAVCDPSIQVALARNGEFTIAENSVDGQCMAEFFDVPAGRYHVKVTGRNVTNLSDAEYTIGEGGMYDFEVRARHTSDSEAMAGPTASAFVSVKELGIPAGAGKEFDKANHSISKQDWAKASSQLRKAIELYPDYAAAYNNLGAIYSRTGDLNQARQALEKAATLNDHFALAYANLGRLSFTTKDFPGVETFLGKVASLETLDIGELELLAYAQLTDQHFDLAVETADKAHRGQVGHHQFLHLLAARAADLRGGSSDVIVQELQEYLKEDPNGPYAERAKTALATLQAQTQTQSPMTAR